MSIDLSSIKEQPHYVASFRILDRALDKYILEERTIESSKFFGGILGNTATLFISMYQEPYLVDLFYEWMKVAQNKIKEKNG